MQSPSIRPLASSLVLAIVSASSVGPSGKGRGGDRSRLTRLSISCAIAAAILISLVPSAGVLGRGSQIDLRDSRAIPAGQPFCSRPKPGPQPGLPLPGHQLLRGSRGVEPEVRRRPERPEPDQQPDRQRPGLLDQGRLGRPREAVPARQQQWVSRRSPATTRI